MKCPNCRSEMKYNKCPDCDFKRGSTGSSDYSAPETCCVCNNTKERGMKFTLNKDTRESKRVCYCFWCWQEYSNRGFNIDPSPTFKTKEEATLAMAASDDILRQLFEGKAPNWIKYEKLAAKVNESIIADMSKREPSIKVVSGRRIKAIGDVVDKIKPEVSNV